MTPAALRSGGLTCTTKTTQTRTATWAGHRLKAIVETPATSLYIPWLTFLHLEDTWLGAEFLMDRRSGRRAWMGDVTVAQEVGLSGRWNYYLRTTEEFLAAYHSGWCSKGPSRRPRLYELVSLLLKVRYVCQLICFCSQSFNYFLHGVVQSCDTLLHARATTLDWLKCIYNDTACIRLLTKLSELLLDYRQVINRQGV